MQFVPSEKTATIRYPSIAHLMVDSNDRDAAVYEYCNDFQISKRNNLLNGYFTRIGATEVVFEWLQPNVYHEFNTTITYTVGDVFRTFEMPTGFYTVADALNELVRILNTFTTGEFGTGLTWAVSIRAGGGANLTATASIPDTTFAVDGVLITQLTRGPISGFTDPAINVALFEIGASTSDLRPARYVDIVCSQLTNNQSVKDASTAAHVRDVLVRWYFDYDNQNPTDEYEFPILMGYSPFFLRRLYNPPKQIQWQTNIPVGNLSFQLYRDDGELMPVNSATDFLMTLQISEN